MCEDIEILQNILRKYFDLYFSGFVEVGFYLEL